MSRHPRDVESPSTLLLALVALPVTAFAGWLALLPAADASAAVSTTLLLLASAALAAVVGFRPAPAPLAVRAARIPTARQPGSKPGDITDTDSHPARPRAPGLR